MLSIIFRKRPSVRPRSCHTRFPTNESSRFISTRSGGARGSPITGARMEKTFTFILQRHPPVGRGGVTFVIFSGTSASSPSKLDKKGPRKARALHFLRSRSVGENCQQQQRHDVRNLDHRVHGRSRRVLVGVADGVAGDRRL